MRRGGAVPDIQGAAKSTMREDCEKCLRKAERLLAEYDRERERWNMELEEKCPTVDCSPKPPNLFRELIWKCRMPIGCPLREGDCHGP